MMKKTLSLLLSVPLLAAHLLAQSITDLENAQKNRDENTYHPVVGSLNLKPRFTYDSDHQREFSSGAYKIETSYAPSMDRNFVRSELVFKEGVTTDEEVIALGSGDKSISISYSDGMGRTIQSVSVQASPDLKDLVQPYYYDGRNRPSRTYLPYRSTGASGAYRSSAFTEQATFYNNPSPGVTADSRAYASTIFEDSPLERVLGITNVGEGFQAAIASEKFSVNTDNIIRKWEIMEGLPRSTTTYPEGSLSVLEYKDEAGAILRTFTDFAGRVVLEQTQSSDSAWLSTYFVHNDYNELLFIIPPQSADTFTPDEEHINLWYFQYEYDALGRRTGVKAPGAGWVYTIYDRWDRPVLTQDAVQRSKSTAEWTYIKYDVHNRPVITGLISSLSTREAITTEVANSSIRNEIRNSSAVGYTLDRTYPATANEAGLISIVYYDNYDFRTNPGWSGNNSLYAFSAEPLYTGQQQTKEVKGLATGSKYRTQGAYSVWMNSVTYYDEQYQPIQSVSSHHMNGTVRTSTQYAFSGEVEKSVNIYTHHGGTTRVERRYTYDNAGRPIKVYHKINNNPEVMLSHFLYNELGMVSDILHHSKNDGTTWLYKTSLNSTVQGWPDEIAYLFADGKELFRQKLHYQRASGTGNVTRTDGMVTSNLWKHYGTEPERAYNYDYDIPKRLTLASYLEKSGTSWTLNQFYSENIIYGANGNITALARNQEKSGVMAQIDKLTYDYHGNQLTAVSDIAPAVNKAEGFVDGYTGNDYSYNANGYLKEDKNKGITSVTYNILDLPQRIDFSDGKNIRYTYNTGGGLVTVSYHANSGGSAVRTIQHVGELLFENGILKEIRHGSGRVLADAGYKYQYYLKDHLGSTRVVLQEDPDVFTATATFEESATKAESAQFIDYEKSIRIVSNLFDHTGAIENGQALRLIGGETGPARSVSVLPGDTVKMEVFVKYLDVGRNKKHPALIAAAASISAANPAGMGVEGGASVTNSTAASGVKGLAGLLTSKQRNNEAPPAYLNYLFFDGEMNYKYGGFVQMSEAAREDGSNVAHERLFQEVVAEEPGYFYIYLSNEATEGGEAFFDDFTVRTQESYIVQQTDYYPYGLIARNYVRAGERETFDLFQGKTYEELTGWYDFHARQYDAALGRWFGIDPQSQFLSPYLAMGNNPVMMVDPDGEFVFAIPHISFSSGGIDVGLTVGVGIPGGLSAQLTVGNNFGTSGNNTYAALSASAGGLTPYAGFGTKSGFMAGIGYGFGSPGQMTNITSFGLSYSQNGGFSINGFGAHFGRDGFIFNPSFGYGYSFVSGSEGRLIPNFLACDDCAFEVDLPPFEIVRQRDSYIGPSRWRGGNQIAGMANVPNVNFALTVIEAVYGALSGANASQGFWLGENGKYYSQKWGGNQYAGKRVDALKAAKLYRLAGKTTMIAAAGVGLYAVIDGYQLDGGRFGYHTKVASASSLGGIAGGIAGAKGGMLVGSAIGVWFGGVGAVPGSIVGGFIGGIGGSLFGSYVGRNTVNFYHQPYQ